MTLTVIVPTYNRVSLLPGALLSLLRQVPDLDIPLDLLVIDDGSTDGTPEYLARMAQTHPMLRVVRTANQGVCRARNEGLAALLPETTLVSFLDSDDISPPGRLASDLAVLSARPEIDLTYGTIRVVHRLDPEAMTPYPGDEYIDIVVPQLSSAIFRRTVLERTGQFDTGFLQAEDTDYLLRVFESGTRFAQTPTICAYYLRHDGNMTRRFDESRRYFLKALHRSLKRRQADPSRRLSMPKFDVNPIATVDYY